MHRKLDESLLSGYLFKLAQFQDVSGYHTLEIIHETVDFVLEQTPKNQQDRLDYIQTLCDLVANTTTKDISFTLLGVSGRGQPLIWPSTPAQNHLAAAVYYGMSSLSTAMIESGVKDTKTYFGTALHCAIRRDSLDTAALLIEKGGAVPSMVEFGEAGRNGNEAMLQLLFGAELKNESKVNHYLQAIKGAAAGGHWSTIRFLIDMAISNDAVYDIENLVMHTNSTTRRFVYDDTFLEATIYNQMDVAKAALNCGANLRSSPRFARDKWFYALGASSKMGYEGLVRMLLEKGSGEDKYVLQEALHLAIRRGWLRIAQILMDNGAEPTPYKKHNGNHLMVAVKYGQSDMLKLLLDTKLASLKVDAGICNEVYSYAVSHGYTTIMRHFVDYGLVTDLPCISPNNGHD
jgi:ankyrin repeat protein